MKLLRWMAGITRVHRIRNEKISERFDIATIADKLRQSRLRCHLAPALLGLKLDYKKDEPFGAWSGLCN
ncbi:hypothetical protein ANCDUO_04783 [Ancylostoma duodenale]|uniref:Uncharacterized protein n=1 Tax=Ancylostoma duodenale TaxID=51022 RepID=A0A0C2H668_9BILA|nr:hypothetical protein ANCDUO_04783 [Ancylostoma duodenale]